MLSTLITVLLITQINPYGDATANIIVPSAASKLGLAAGTGGGVAQFGYPAAVPATVGQYPTDPSGAVVVEGVPGGMNQVNLDYIRPPDTGLSEDYRLAQLLIARTAARRMEALRLQLAARNIEVTNAQLREYLCSRFCNPVATQMPTIPSVPMFPTMREAVADPFYGAPAPIDPALYPQPLPYVPPRDDFNARYYIRHGGTVQVQVLPNVPVYRRGY